MSEGAPTCLEVGHWVSATERIIELRKFKYGWRAKLLDQSVVNEGVERVVKSTESPDGLPVLFAVGETPRVLPWPADYPPVEELEAEVAGGTAPAAPAESSPPAADALPPWPELPARDSDIRRDRFKRPMVLPPDGDKEVAYTRATTFAETLEDKFMLNQWGKRMVARGIADRPDLQLAAIAHQDDRNQLNDVAEQALEAAKGRAAATTGTALHALTEVVDRGDPLPPLPEVSRVDLAAYRAFTHQFKVLAIELFTVVDDLRVAGTADRVYEIDGRRYIGDLKTGKIDFGAGKIAIQLALYSRGVAYDHETRTRTPLPGVDQDRGIIIHLPAGTGTVRLLWVDIAKGWEMVPVAQRVRDWKNEQKGVFEEWALPPLEDAIRTAPDPFALEGLWHSRHAEFTPDHVTLAKSVKAALQGAA